MKGNEQSFEDFFNELKKKINLDEINKFELSKEFSEDLFNYLEINNINYNSMFLIGNSLIELSLETYIDSLKNNNQNEIILKTFLIKQKEEYRKLSFINRDILALLAVYNKKPLCNLYKKDGSSNRISSKLKKRFSILEKCNFKCVYCGRSPPLVRLEFEHVIPKSKGGTDNDNNIVVSCRDCNIGKKDKIIDFDIIKMKKVCNEKGVQSN